jgi:hypothetical protein
MIKTIAMRPLRIGAVLVCAACMLGGCKSRPLGPYVSPRVTGQVCSADHLRPLSGVTVTRGNREPDVASPPKGAEVLMRPGPVMTDSQGRFSIPGYRVLSIFRGADWSHVRLSFAHPGYLGLSTNFSLSMATNTVAGEPLVQAGTIFLEPQPH